MLGDRSALVIDLRPSMSYRKEHIDGAVWSIRPRVATDATAASAVVLVADEPEIAALAALDLAEAGVRDVRVLSGGHEAARAAGLPMASTPRRPADADCIDFLFFTAGRHEGDEAAARQYLDLGDRPGRPARRSRARLVQDCRGAVRLSRGCALDTVGELVEPRLWRTAARSFDSAQRRRSTCDGYAALMLERCTWSRFLPSMRMSFTGASRLGECTSPTS